jgi:uncharacterized delta-60 repeat protein
MQQLAGRKVRRFFRCVGRARLWLVILTGLIGGLAQAQPANDFFANATVLSGLSGTINGTNGAATMEGCERSPVYCADYGGENVDLANSVWYRWTAPASGTAEFNTLHSSFDTVLAVYTTTNGLCDPSLTLVADDDDTGHNDYSDTNYTSYLTFAAKAGTTYYIEVSGNADDYPPDDVGSIVLNWSLTGIPDISSGTFRFAASQSYNGGPEYVVSASDSTSPISADGNTVNPSVRGARVTVTRTGGSSGRVSVDYTVSALTYTNYTTTISVVTNTYLSSFTSSGLVVTNYSFTTIMVSNNFGYFDAGYQVYSSSNTVTATTNLSLAVTNSGILILSITNTGSLIPAPTNMPVPNLTMANIVISPQYNIHQTNTDNATYTNILNQSVYEPPSTVVSNIVSSASGFGLSRGTLTFDDYQMSQDILVPVYETPGPDAPSVSYIPNVATVTLSNPLLDTNESPDLMPPTVDPVNGVALLSALNPQFVSTPGLFNFERSTFRVDRNEGSATISVNRVGGNPQDSASVDYFIDPSSVPGGEDDAGMIAYGSPGNRFPLQAGSDYATPNTDYTPVTGTLTWAADDFNPKQITIPILNSGQVQFNQDMLVQLHNPLPKPSTSDPGYFLGEVNAATLTILFDDTIVLGGLAPGQQPAGAVDRSWNKNGFSDSNPPFITYPGTAGNGGTVYAVAEQPNGDAIIAGSFNSFDQNTYNRIVRVLPNGYQDPTFLVSPNSGVSRQNEFITALALQPDGSIIIGGNFTSFNGNNRHGIARLNADGTLDTTFNPGLGVNGTVWSVALQSNGQIVIGGQFTSVNTNSLNDVARLNADGTVDTSFNPGLGPEYSGSSGITNGVVNAVAVDSIGRVIIGGQFDSVSGFVSGGIARLNVDGSLDTGFAPGIGTFNPVTLASDPVNALAVQPNGQILIAGGFSYFDLDSYNGIVRLNPDGTVDLSFDPGTGTHNPVTGFSDTIYAMLLQPDGNILVGGDFTTFNQTRRVGVARLFTDGTVDTSFMDTAYDQFAGVPNHYHNPNAVNASLYPSSNERNYIYALALESGGNVIIGGGFSYVGGGSTRDDTRPRSNVARLIGNSTPGPGNIEFSYGSYSADKPNNGASVNNLYVSLVRTNGNLGIISAAFTTNTAPPGAGIAVPNVDFSFSQTYATPTWTTAWYGAWMYDIGVYGPNYATGVAGVYVSIYNDGQITGNLNANFALSNPNGTDIFLLGGENIPLGAALGALSTAPLTIIDDNYNAGVLGFSSPQYTVVENGGTATITVTRTNGTQNVVQVSYSTANGSAVAGVDFTNVTGTLTFNNGDTSKTFTIPIINGTTVQPDRTVILKLYTPTGGATLGLTNAVLTIVNDNIANGHISFTSTNYSTNEISGTAYVAVSRLGGSSGSINVTLRTADGSAVNGVDYIGYSNTLSWASKNAATITVPIPVMHDTLVTSNRTVNLMLTNMTLNTFPTNLWGLNTNATLTIVNVDSAGTIQFGSPVYSVKKYGGFALIPVLRTGGSVGTVTAYFSTIPGTAAPGVNYFPTNGTLTFASGQLSQYITVPIVDDGTVDGLKSLTLALSNASPSYALGSPSNATLNIIDTASVDESPGSPDVTYSGGFNNTVYALALQGNNQLLAGGDFTLADGVPRQRIARLNADGSLDAGFSMPSSTYGANGSVRAVAIQADGRILVGGVFTNFNSVVLNHMARLNSDGSLDSQFTPGSGADNPVYALAETFVGGLSKIMVGGSFATLCGTSINGIARLNSDGSLDTAFNPGLGANATVYALAVQPADGKVVLGGDFTAVNGNTNFNHIARLNTDGSVDATFNPGVGANDSIRAIAIQSDGRILIGGLFTNVNGVVLNHIARLNTDGSVDNTFVSGVGANDAVFSIALQSDSRIVLGGEFNQCSGVTRNGITRLNPDGTVDPTINFGTGANNFVAAVAIQEDTIQGYPTNVPDEKIIIGGGFTQYNGQPYAYLARIYGGSVSGPGTFSFSSSVYGVDELNTNVVITIIRTGGTSGTNSNGSGDVLVPFATSAGTAVAGVNYSNVVVNLDFPVGEVIRTVSIPVMDDNVITTNLTVNLAVTPSLASEYGGQPTALLWITNDDSAISFTAATYVVPKNVINGVAVVGVERLGSTHGTSSVVFGTTSGGTAQPGTDYTPVGPSVVTFNPGVSSAIVTIPINNNGLVEGNRTVTMQLAGVTGSALYSPSNAVLTIIDTATSPGQLSFSMTNYSITEGGGVGYVNAYITVVRTLGSAGAVSANYTTLDGTATAGIKYIPTNGSVSFGDGETTPKTFAVQVRNTTTAEGPEYLNLVLTTNNATDGAILVAPTNSILTILNTNTGVAFAAATNTFSETGGANINGNLNTVLITVLRFNNTNGTTTVNFATADGTAQSNVNYFATGGTLTFNPGDSAETIPVMLIHDTNVTGTLTFTLNLSSPSPDAQLTPPSTTVIQELDAESGLSFTATNVSVLKTAGYVILPVISSNPSIGPVSVNYSTGGGTAVPGVDYTSTSGTLTFTNGQFVNYIGVTIIPNSLLQSNQTFNVTLSSPVSPGVLVSPVVETVTIIETNTPSGLNYYSPIATNSDWGSVSVDNNVNFGSPLAWFAWTPTNSGEAEFDTIGSVDDAVGVTNLATAMGVFTGTSMATLNQVVINEGIYTRAQYNYSGQNVFNLSSTNAIGMNGSNNPAGSPVMVPISGYFYQPYSSAGPSEVRFNAVAGQTYYIAVETYMGMLSEAETVNGNSSALTFNTVYSPPAGMIKLNWALHPSGVFRFASEDLDETGLTYSNGIPMLLYRVSETEGTRRVTGTYNANQMNTTVYGTTYQNGGHSGYVFDVPGLLVKVTRVAGSTGRVQVGYTTEDIAPGSSLMGPNGTLLNGDLPASSSIPTIIGTNVLVAEQDYVPVSGVLTFDDSEMSKDIFIPIEDDGGLPRQNRDFLIVLTNAVLDSTESTDVQAPRLDNTLSQALVRILDTDIDPKGPAQSSILVTNINPITLLTNVFTNIVWNIQPTNGVFNFEKAHYRVTRDISNYWGGTPITVYVNRMGTNLAASPTIYWRVNSYYLDKTGDDLLNGYFPLQPGSDYATPDPVNNTGILGLVSDFHFSSYNGTISFPSGAGAFNPQPITFAVYNNGLQQFNEDFTISLYEEDKNGNPIPAGMVDQTTVTILFNDNTPPAGSVDEFYNADYGLNMAAPINTVPQQMAHPGTDGEVYGLAVQPDNKTIIVGDFTTYDQTARKRIARINTDGSLDTAFDPSSGPNQFVRCIALTTNNESVIGGAFSSYAGVLRNGIALITTNGTLDTAFNPGQGFVKGTANGTVYTLAFQTNGEILAGGDFTSYNGVPRQYLALLNPDGSLDRSFDPGTNLNAAVYAIAVQSGGQVVVGGGFTSVGGVTGQNYIARLNADGSFDPGFDPGSGANAAVHALGLQPDGNIVVGGEFSMMNGQSANSIARLNAGGFTDPNFFQGVGADGPVYDIVVNTNAIFWTTNSAASPNSPVAAQTNFTIYVGGAFTAYNGTPRLGFTRLNPDGTVDTMFMDTAYNQFAGLPRDHYNDPRGTVLASGVQSDGNVMIGGTFARVGGGQSDDVDVRPESIDTNDVLIAEEYSGDYGYYSQVQKTRAGIRNRNNVARLIGGATPGPGNIGLLYNTYSINKSQSPLYVSLIRTNGSLGLASANFSVLPGLAQSGVDYDYSGLNPLYSTVWEYTSPMGRMHSDGLFGINGFAEDPYGRFWSGSGTQSSVVVNIIENTNSLSNLSAQFQMVDPMDADQFYLGGENIPLGVALGESIAPLTLIDDHHLAGTFGFASSSYTGMGQGAVISIARTNGSYGQVYLSYATTTNGSTAILNSDYTAASGTLTFQPGDLTHTFTVPILTTNSANSAEKIVNLMLFGLNAPANGVASWGLTNAVLRIINPNFQGYLNLNTNAYAANLSAGSATITVTRTVGSKGTLTVQCATTDGTAINGQDYFGITTNLQWNNGDVTPRTVTIPLFNHSTNGPARQFGVFLSNPALNGVSAPALFATNGVTNAVVVINNDNSYGTFQFSAPSYVANDDGGYSTITVIRTGGTNGTATVQYATADATAFAGTNYVGVTNTLTFAPSQLAASFTVMLLTNGGAAEPPPNAFYFTVSLSNPSAGASLGSPIIANNYIVDSESYDRPPGSMDTSFNPGTGMNGDVFALALQSSGKVLAGGAFTAVNGVPESYIARLNSDGSLDRSGFLYGLSGASGAVYALVDQTDDQILAGGAFTNFDGTILNRIVRLNTDGTLDSSFNPGAGADNTVYGLAETFIGGVRKIYAAGTFSSMNGNPTPYIARLNDDGTVDAQFAAGAGPGAAVYAVAAYPTNSPLAGKVLIGGVFASVNNFAVGHIARLNVDGSVDTNFDANLSVGAGDIVRAIAIQSDGRVLVGGDFTNFDGVALNHIARLNPDGSLDAAFAAGVGVGANSSVSAIAVQADNRIVVAGQFTRASGVTRNGITRLLPTGAMDPSINFGDGANGAVDAVVIQPADQMLVIGGGFTQYDDLPAGHMARIYGGSITGPGAFTFTSPTYQVDENGIQALIGIRRTGGTSGTNVDGSGSVFVNFATTTNGTTAQPGINYSNVNVQVGFPPGEVLQSVLVPVMNDSKIEPNLTVNLSLSSPTPPAGLVDQTNAVLTIINDNSAVSFGSASYSVPKNISTGVGTIHVVRLGTASGTNSVTVITTTNGTAVPGVDFYPTNLTVTFGNGQTDIVVQVPIINNASAGPSPTVVFALANPVNTLLYSPSNTTLTIINTVTAAGQVGFAATNFVANAAAGAGYLTIQRINGKSGSISVHFNTVQSPSDTAVPNVNYTPVNNGSVSFDGDQTNATATVPLLNNSLVEGPVTLSVELFTNQNGSDTTTLVAPTNATLTIVNTNPVVAFTVATNTFSETAGTVFINVVRYNNLNGTNLVNFATVDGTAQAGVNYVSASGSLTFSPGQSIVTIPVTLIHDTNVTGTLAFTLKLSNLTGGGLLASPSTTVIQELDAEAGLSFMTNAVSVPKLTVASFVTISVICSNPGIEPVVQYSNGVPVTVPLEVNYATADGTAAAGQDYSPASGTLVFTNNVGTNTFQVQILGNTLITGSRTFTVRLTNATAPGMIVSPSNQVVTIVDNNSGLSFSHTTFTVLRSSATATNITVVRTDNTNTISSVNFATADGTAVAGTDYQATGGTLVFTNGVTSQTFPVNVYSSATVQPDKTVLLQLSTPTNGVLSAPYSATLIIHDTSGSLVVPAGSVLIHESGPTNGIIDPGENVTLLFGFRVAGGNNVTNLVATLIATNGVTSPTSPNGTATQSYGRLATNGPSASRAFSFTASGTNGQQIVATFRLTNGVTGTGLGTALFTYTLGTWTTTFYNTNAIIINAGTQSAAVPGSPYPSIITVSNLGGLLIKATITLTNMTHTAPAAINTLLVSPNQNDALFMSHAGGGEYGGAINGVTLTFDDAATNSLPSNGLITNGIYKPTRIGGAPIFP